MTWLVIFCASFSIVFMLGLQSLSVNGGHELVAFTNSCLIGCVNAFILTVIPKAEGLEIVAYIAGGPLGIVASMRFFRWYRAQKEQRLVIKTMVDCRNIMERK